MKALRFLPALALVVLAVLVALLAADVRGWQRTFASDDGRTSSNWDASPRVPWNLAGRLLGVGDDVHARRAIRLYEQTVSTRARLDNARHCPSPRMPPLIVKDDIEKRAMYAGLRIPSSRIAVNGLS